MPTNYSEEQIATALELSIEKWKANALTRMKHTAKIFAETCPLCHLFWKEDEDMPEEQYCEGCPVKKRTGFYGCQGTPWVAVRDAYYDNCVSVQEFRELAQAEVNFLESLRTSKP